MNAFFAMLPAIMVLAANPAFGHESTAAKADVALEERLGQKVPSLVLHDQALR